MADQNLDYVAIRRNIEKSLHRQKRLYRMIFFWTHLIAFVVTMLVVWGIVTTDSQVRALLFNSEPGASLIVILPTFVWAVMILCHIASLFVESDAGEKGMREQLLMGEIGEEILRKGLTDEGMLEKPKRRAAALEAERVVLSDDGELIPVDKDKRLEQRGYNARTNNAGDS
jgi:hypothetical protein